MYKNNCWTWQLTVNLGKSILITIIKPIPNTTTSTHKKCVFYAEASQWNVMRLIKWLEFFFIVTQKGMNGNNFVLNKTMKLWHSRHSIDFRNNNYVLRYTWIHDIWTVVKKNFLSKCDTATIPSTFIFLFPTEEWHFQYQLVLFNSFHFVCVL